MLQTLPFYDKGKKKKKDLKIALGEHFAARLLSFFFSSCVSAFSK